MINFTYIIGANIELFVQARLVPADDETQSPEEVEIIGVKDSEGLEVETLGISIEGESLDQLLKIAAFEHKG